MYDVIVVGAGISGLHAANCLVQEGLDVLVLEARGRVGGRTCTQHDSKFDYAEMGGAYFGRHQTRVISLAESLGLQLYKLPSDGMSTIHLEGQSYPYREDGIPPLSIATLLDWNNILLKMDQMSRKVPMAAPWDAPEAALWDSMSVEDFINKTCWTGFVRKMMLTGLSVVYGHFCEDISLLYCLQTIRVSGGIRALFGSINGLQESKLIGGSAAISIRLAERLKGRVQLCCPVRQIQQTEDHVTVVTDNGASRQARRLVVACSPHVVSKLNFEPALPTRLSQLLQFDPKTDDIIKTVMYYEEAFWRRKGLRGEVIGDRDQPVLYAIDDTKHDGQHPAIMGFANPRAVGHLPVNERKATIANYYAKAFGIEALARPVHYVERSWSDEDSQMFSGPCVFTCPPGYLTKHNRFWGEKFQLVHFAGTETSVVFRGYMDGAVRAAERVTQEVLDSLGKTSRRVYKPDLEEIPYIPAGTVDRFLPSIPTLIGAVTIVLPLLGVVAHKLWE